MKEECLRLALTSSGLAQPYADGINPDLQNNQDDIHCSKSLPAVTELRSTQPYPLPSSDFEQDPIVRDENNGRSPHSLIKTFSFFPQSCRASSPFLPYSLRTVPRFVVLWSVRRQPRVQYNGTRSAACTLLRPLFLRIQAHPGYRRFDPSLGVRLLMSDHSLYSRLLTQSTDCAMTIWHI